MQQYFGKLVLVLLMVVLALGSIIDRVLAASTAIESINIPITGATYSGSGGDFNVSGAPPPVTVTYSNGASPVTYSNTIFSFKTNGLQSQVSNNGSKILYSSGGTFGSISLLDANNGFSPVLLAQLIALDMEIISPGAFSGTGYFAVNGGALASDFGTSGGLATIGITFAIPASFNTPFAALANTQLFPQRVSEPSASLCLGMVIVGLVSYGWWSQKKGRLWSQKRHLVG